MTETLSVVRLYDLRSAAEISATDNLENLGCSTPLVVGDTLHVVLNTGVPQTDNKIEKVESHFLAVQLGDALRRNKTIRGGSRAGRLTRGKASGTNTRVRCWRMRGRAPVRSIQTLDPSCSTLLYAEGSHFCLVREAEGASETLESRAGAPKQGERVSPGSKRKNGSGSGGSDSGDPAGGVSDPGSAEIEGAWSKKQSGAGAGRKLTKSLDVHMGSVVDFRVCSETGYVLSGGDHGHVHVVSFARDMENIPDMKVSKFVGCPVSSVRWHPAPSNVVSWTTPKGHFQMLDVRENKVAVNIQAEGQSPVKMHEHVSEYVVAMGHETGRVQLFDVRRVLSFLTVQDPVADDLRQLVPLGGNTDVMRDGGVSGWAAVSASGVSRYAVCANETPDTGPPAPESSRIDAVANSAATVSLDACCRTTGLDLDAGVFLAPSIQGQQQPTRAHDSMYAITHDAHIMTFSGWSADNESSSLQENLGPAGSLGMQRAASSTLTSRTFRDRSA